MLLQLAKCVVKLVLAHILYLLVIHEQVLLHMICIVALLLAIKVGLLSLSSVVIPVNPAQIFAVFEKFLAVVSGSSIQLIMFDLQFVLVVTHLIAQGIAKLG